MANYPKSREEFEERFSTEESCLDYLCNIRWPDGFICPKCENKSGWRSRRGLWECRACGRQTSVTSGTIFHGTRKPLTVWFRVIWDMAGQTTGISARSVKRHLGFGSYQTAWVWLQKLRKTMIRPGRERLCGVVQVDESYWGGKKSGKRGRGAAGKAIIAIAVEDKSTSGDEGEKIGRIRLQHINSTSKSDLWRFIGESVEPNSLIVTDGLNSYSGIEELGYKHEVVKSLDLKLPHLVISQVKRWILGTHQGAVRPSHLPFYLDEFTFRFNRRKSNYRGMLFYRVMQNAVLVPAPPLKNLKALKPNVGDENFDDIYADHNM